MKNDITWEEVLTTVGFGITFDINEEMVDIYDQDKHYIQLAWSVSYSPLDFYEILEGAIAGLPWSPIDYLNKSEIDIYISENCSEKGGVALIQTILRCIGQMKKSQGTVNIKPEVVDFWSKYRLTDSAISKAIQSYEVGIDRVESVPCASISGSYTPMDQETLKKYTIRNPYQEIYDDWYTNDALKINSK